MAYSISKGKKAFYVYAVVLLITHLCSVVGYLLRLNETSKASYWYLIAIPPFLPKTLITDFCSHKTVY